MYPEQRLWLGIVEQAIADLRSTLGRGTPNGLRIIKHEMNSKWFKLVAEHAGLHVDTITQIIKKVEETTALKSDADKKKYSAKKTIFRKDSFLKEDWEKRDWGFGV